MRTLLASLAVLSSLGCDSPGLVANIETFLCGVIPWYAADCTDPEVQARALSVLENGIVQAHMRCEMTASAPCPAAFGAKFDLLQDNTSIVWAYFYDGSSDTNFVLRNDTPCACKRNWSAGVMVDGPCVCAAGGKFYIDGVQGCYAEQPISNVCMGFNLEAFD